MKKFYLLMMAAFYAATVLIGCSDDDDKGNSGNGNGAGDGGSGVTVLPKKVAKIQYLDANGKPDDIYLFQYGTDGRLIKVINQWGPAGNLQEDEKTFSYGNDKITITEDDEVTVIQMRDGRAIDCTEKDGPDWEYTNSFSYSGNYLSQREYTEKHLVNGVWDAAVHETNTYTTKDGNLVAAKSIWKEGNNQTITNTTVEYSNVANNANIDLGYVCNDVIDEEELLMLCVLGNRYQNLPSKVVMRDDEGWSYTATYSYEVNKEGYVVKITCNSFEEDSSGTYPSSEVCEIIYE